MTELSAFSKTGQLFVVMCLVIGNLFTKFKVGMACNVYRIVRRTKTVMCCSEMRMMMINSSWYPVSLYPTQPSLRIRFEYVFYSPLSHTQFLGAFAKLWKATVSFVMSVRPHETTRLPLDGVWWNLRFVLKICQESLSFIKIRQE